MMVSLWTTLVKYGEWLGSYLDNGLAANEVSAAANSNAAVRAVDYILAALNQAAQVAELCSAVCVGEEHVLAAGVTEAMGDGAALAAVALELDNADDVVEAFLLRKVEADINGTVLRPVVHNEDFVAAQGLGRRVLGASARRRGAVERLGRGGRPAKVLIEVCGCFFKGGKDARRFVVGGEHDCDAHVGGVDSCARVGDVARVGQVSAGLGDAALGEPAVEPARQ